MNEEEWAERLAPYTVERERADLIELVDLCIAATRRDGWTEHTRSLWRSTATRVQLVRAALGRERGDDPHTALIEGDNDASEGGR